VEQAVTIRFGRRKPPPRKPHPDAQVESELQRILSLRRAIGRKESLIRQDAEDLRKIRTVIRRYAGADFNRARKADADVLVGEMASLEAEVTKLHDEIAARVSTLHDSDLAWLDQ
jgi:hypothetical protein